MAERARGNWTTRPSSKRRGVAFVVAGILPRDLRLSALTRATAPQARAGDDGDECRAGPCRRAEAGAERAALRVALLALESIASGMNPARMIHGDADAESWALLGCTRCWGSREIPRLPTRMPHPPALRAPRPHSRRRLPDHCGRVSGAPDRGSRGCPRSGRRRRGPSHRSRRRRVLRLQERVPIGSGTVGDGRRRLRGA